MPEKSGAGKFFPSKLRVMLDQVDRLGLSRGASWVSEGRAFAIHDPDVFMTDIAPHFFEKQSCIRSFHRQLSIWGFLRLEKDVAGRGVWHHKYFIQDKPEMIKLIKRVPVKNPKQTVPTSKRQLPDYTKYRLSSSPQTHSQVDCLQLYLQGILLRTMLAVHLPSSPINPACIE
ncbi:hypothetical protein ACHAW5_008137 [Stephanodiscus triporus]|uniref:HSF-type DNA-binding domain-containing protein n=1 Tax=Stephanodiscus triporus TaxID=2934178 RepID=A0ABD3PAC8_9STRA